MSGIDTISNSPPLASARRVETPVVQVSERERPRPTDQNLSTQHRSQTRVVEVPAQTDYARLNYDADAKKVVLEVLDPRTGDVFLRLPFEVLSENFVREIVSDRGLQVDIST